MTCLERSDPRHFASNPFGLLCKSCQSGGHTDEIGKLPQIPATRFLLHSLSFAEFLALLLTICVTFSKQSDPKKGGGKNHRRERIEQKSADSDEGDRGSGMIVISVPGLL